MNEPHVRHAAPDPLAETIAAIPRAVSLMGYQLTDRAVDRLLDRATHPITRSIFWGIFAGSIVIGLMLAAAVVAGMAVAL